MTALARKELRGAAPGRPSAVTVGVFDGVHLGHRYLISGLIERARKRGIAAGVVTLYPDPVAVLRPGHTTSSLSGIDERLELLRGTGLDFVVALTFSPEVAALDPAAFVSLLKDELDLKLLLMGPDNTFGRDREGSPERMRGVGAMQGFEVEVLETALVAHEHPVHSTSIRAALSEGDLESVRQQLGRRYSLSGAVVQGDRRGRELGYPTANIEVAPDRALPAFGVYATWAYLDGRRYASATNVGLRPQFDGKAPSVETYIFDFDGEIYGRTLKIEFVERISPEMKFETIEQLKAKIAHDVERAREILRE